MHYSRLALVAPALFVSVSAFGQSIIQNQCNFPVYYFEDNGTQPADAANYKLPILAPGQKYTKQMYQTGKANDAGPSIKLAVPAADGTIPNIGNLDMQQLPQTQFEYTAHSAGDAWFDISNVNANGDPPFKNFGLHIFAVQDPNNVKSTKTCDPGTVVCQHGGEQNGYQNSNDDAVSMCNTPNTNDVQLTLCSASKGSSGGTSGNSGNSGNSGPASVASSPPASSASAAPVKVENHQAVQPASSSPVSSSPPQQQQQKAGATVIITQTFTAPTVVETVHVLQERDVNEKREEHVHAHANAHKKISKRRHGN